MDFAGRYSFVCQDSTQGFYFNNNTVAVFPAVIYYKEPDINKIIFKNFCVVSDTSKQSASTVNIFLEKIINEIKSSLS